MLSGTESGSSALAIGKEGQDEVVTCHVPNRRARYSDGNDVGAAENDVGTADEAWGAWQ